MFQFMRTWGQRPALLVAKQGHRVKDGGSQGLQTTGAVCVHPSQLPQADLAPGRCKPCTGGVDGAVGLSGACSQAIVSETEQGCCSQGSSHGRQRAHPGWQGQVLT